MIKKISLLFLTSYFLFLGATICATETQVAHPQLYVLPTHDKRPSLNAIENAKKSIHLVMYRMTKPAFINALIDAKKRGVDVEIILSKITHKVRSKQRIKDGNLATRNQLTAANINVYRGAKRFNYTHEKMLLIDRHTAYIMTGNYTSSKARDFVFKTQNPKYIQEILNVFNADKKNESFSLTKPNLIWSPINSYPKLVALINHAKVNLFLYAPSLSNKGLRNALVHAKKRGVDISILTNLSGKLSPSSKRTLSYLKKRKITIKHIKKPYIHAKVLLQDYGTQHSKAFIGSQNFNTNSLHYNRELGAITEDKKVLTTLYKTFQKDLKL